MRIIKRSKTAQKSELEIQDKFSLRIFSRQNWTKFCLGLHTAVVFRMQSFNLQSDLQQLENNIPSFIIKLFPLMIFDSFGLLKLSSLASSVHTPPSYRVRHRNFIFGMNMSLVYVHQIFSDSEFSNGSHFGIFI